MYLHNISIIVLYMRVKLAPLHFSIFSKPTLFLKLIWKHLKTNFQNLKTIIIFTTRSFFELGGAKFTQSPPKVLWSTPNLRQYFENNFKTFEKCSEFKNLYFSYRHFFSRGGGGKKGFQIIGEGLIIDSMPTLI